MNTKTKASHTIVAYWNREAHELRCAHCDRAVTVAPNGGPQHKAGS